MLSCEMMYEDFVTRLVEFSIFLVTNFSTIFADRTYSVSGHLYLPNLFHQSEDNNYRGTVIDGRDTRMAGSIKINQSLKSL